MLSQDPPALPKHSNDPHQPPWALLSLFPGASQKAVLKRVPILLSQALVPSSHQGPGQEGVSPVKGGITESLAQGCSKPAQPGELGAGDAGWEEILDLLETEEDLTQETLHILGIILMPCASTASCAQPAHPTQGRTSHITRAVGTLQRALKEGLALFHPADQAELSPLDTPEQAPYTCKPRLISLTAVQGMVAQKGKVSRRKLVDTEVFVLQSTPCTPCKPSSPG